MDYRIIKSPSKGALELVERRMGLAGTSSFDHADAIGLVQGKMIDMICAADIAEKAVGVEVYDIRGICPQHMTLLAICGDTASVSDALKQIEFKLKEGMYCDYGQTY